MQTTSNSQLEKRFRKSRRGAFTWIAALERLFAEITILRVPSLGRRGGLGRQSIRYSRARCTPGVDAYPEMPML